MNLTQRLALAAAPLALSACVSNPVNQTAGNTNEPLKPIGINQDKTCADAGNRGQIGELLAKARVSATNAHNECVVVLAGKKIRNSNLVDTNQPTASFIGRVNTPSCEDTGFQAQAAAKFDKQAARELAIAEADCEKETQIAEKQLEGITTATVTIAAKANKIPKKDVVVEVTSPKGFSLEGLKSNFNIQSPSVPTAEQVGGRVEKAAEQKVQQGVGGFLQKLVP